MSDIKELGTSIVMGSKLWELNADTKEKAQSFPALQFYTVDVKCVYEHV